MLEKQRSKPLNHPELPLLCWNQNLLSDVVTRNGQLVCCFLMIKPGNDVVAMLALKRC